MYERSQYYQYTVCFYNAVLMLNGGETGPRNLTQLQSLSVILLVGALINATIFGNMAVVVQNLNKKSSEFLKKMDTANTAMKNMDLPD